MNNIQNVENEVIKILKQKPETRENDMILFYEYCLDNWVRETEMYRVFNDANFRKNKNIPPFENVSMARKKIQERFPELKSSKTMEALKKAQSR